MLLAVSVLSQPCQDFSCDRISIFIVRLFCFKIEIGAVIVHDRSLPGNNVAALFVKPGQIIVIVLLQYVHEPHNMLVGKVGLFIIGIQSVPCTVFGSGIKNPGISQKTIDIIAVIGYLPVSGNL